jgi:hypothetical protein
MSNGHWSFPEAMGVGSGFVYIIRDHILKRFYIGKKAYRKMNGTPADWKYYISSSNLMGELLKVRPKAEFDFVCLEQYKTKGTMSYAETWSLCFVEAPTTVMFYNTRIEKVSWSVKERITERHKERLIKAVNWEKV